MVSKVKLQLAELLKTARLGIELEFDEIWQVYRHLNDAEKQKAFLLFLQGKPTAKDTEQILRAIKTAYRDGRFNRGYWPHLRRVLHNAEWEEWIVKDE